MHEIYTTVEKYPSGSKQLEREGLSLEQMESGETQHEMKNNPNGENALLYDRIVASAFAAFREKYAGVKAFLHLLLT